MKQGLPLTLSNVDLNGDELTEIINILIHADDVTILSSSREKAIAKLHCLLVYCNMNKILPQYSKCGFVVINGRDNDFGNACISTKKHVSLLGSHIS